MNRCSISASSKAGKRRCYSEDVIAEAGQHIAQSEEEKRHRFWFESAHVRAYLITNPMLLDLKLTEYLPRDVYLVRLLKPVSSKSYDPWLVCKQRMCELDGLQVALSPMDPQAAVILEDLRAALKHQMASSDIMRRLKSDDERESTLDAPDNSQMEFSSLLKFVMRCTAIPVDIPSKEEALYFFAAVAMNNEDAFHHSGTLVVNEVIQTVVSCHASLDKHCEDRRVASDEYERLKIIAKFSKEKLYVPPSCPKKRYCHEGSWAGHRMRNLSLYAVATMMHHWRRPELVETLITNCLRHRLLTRLALLRLLHAVLRNWTKQDKPFTDVTHRLMKSLWETRLVCGEFKESQELMGVCFQRIRSLLGRTSAVFVYPFHLIAQKRSSASKKRTQTTSSFSGQRAAFAKIKPVTPLPPIH